MMIKKKYTTSDAMKVVQILKDKGYLNAVLIGSIAKHGYSYNDIDILLTKEDGWERLEFTDDYLEEIMNDLEDILQPEKIEITDWPSLYFHNTIFGDIDMFLSTKDFDY